MKDLLIATLGDFKNAMIQTNVGIIQFLGDN